MVPDGWYKHKWNLGVEPVPKAVEPISKLVESIPNYFINYKITRF